MDLPLPSQPWPGPPDRAMKWAEAVNGRITLTLACSPDIGRDDERTMTNVRSVAEGYDADPDSVIVASDEWRSDHPVLGPAGELTRVITFTAARRDQSH